MEISTQGNDLIKWAECFNNVIWADEIPWYFSRGLLEPLAMPHMIKKLNHEKIRDAVSKNKALLAYWSDQWDSKPSEWWWTCCDNKQYDIENIQNQRARRGIRKGLRECSVRRVEPKEFIKLTYDIYTSNAESYDQSFRLSTDQYKEFILRRSKYDGFELWIAFVNQKPAAFSTCILIDNAVSLGSTKSNPDLHKHAPNYALFYHITKHYLNERGVSYVNNGHRTLLHTTSIHDFLIRMDYRKIYCRLNIELSKLSSLISLFSTGRSAQIIKYVLKLFPGKIEKFNGFNQLVEISKTF